MSRALPGVVVFAALVAVVTTSAAAPPGCIAGGWPQFRHDSCAGGATSAAEAPARARVPQLREVWRYSTGTRAGAPVVTGRTVFVLSAGGRLHAVELATGKRRWNVATGSIGACCIPAPAVAGNLVVVYDGGNVVRAFDARTGAVRWRREQVGLGVGGWRGSPVITGSTVVVRSHQNVIALALTTGAILWQSAAIDCFGCSVAADAARVYTTGRHRDIETDVERDGVYALDLRTAAERWHGVAGSADTAAGFGAPSRGERAVFGRLTSRGDGVRQISLVAWAADSGAELWRASLGTSRFINFSHPAAGGGIVVYPSTDGRLYALDAATGKKRWAVRIGNTDGSPAIGNGVVYVVGARHRLLALDARDGRVLWRSAAPPASEPGFDPIGSPALAGGYALIGRADGWLLAYRPSSASRR